MFVQKFILLFIVLLLLCTFFLLNYDFTRYLFQEDVHSHSFYFILRLFVLMGKNNWNNGLGRSDFTNCTTFLSIKPSTHSLPRPQALNYYWAIVRKRTTHGPPSHRPPPWFSAPLPPLPGRSGLPSPQLTSFALTAFYKISPSNGFADFSMSKYCFTGTTH